MSSIKCICGNRIYDNSDQLSYKARFVPDMEWFELLDTLSSSALAPPQFQGNEDELWHALTSLSARFFRREAFQCNECGRLWVQANSGSFNCFRPESEFVSKDVLSGNARSPDEFKAQIQRDCVAYWGRRIEHHAESAHSKLISGQTSGPTNPPEIESI